MRTSKPISTINYTTRRFLIDTLESLRKSKIIDFWFFVHHLPEDDREKEHDHVYIELSKMIQTADLIDNFKEYDPTHPTAPLSIRPFESSKFDDAYLYFIHDPDYLASKGQTRKYRYSRSQVETSDDEYLDEKISRIDRSKFTVYGDILKSVSKGENFGQFLLSHRVPLQQIGYFEKAFDSLYRGFISNGSMDAVNRNGREGHDDKSPVAPSSDRDRRYHCTVCGRDDVPVIDAVVRKGDQCTCRDCNNKARARHPAMLLTPDFNVVQTKAGIVDLDSGAILSDADLEQLFIDENYLKHNQK